MLGNIFQSFVFLAIVGVGFGLLFAVSALVAFFFNMFLPVEISQLVSILIAMAVSVGFIVTVVDNW